MHIHHVNSVATWVAAPSAKKPAPESPSSSTRMDEFGVQSAFDSCALLDANCSAQQSPREQILCTFGVLTATRLLLA